jgi:hypothetical protein
MAGKQKPKEFKACTMAELSEMFGLSLPRVTQLYAEGIVVKESMNKVDLIQSVKNYIAKLREKKKDTISVEGIPHIDESKARKEAAQAGLAELKLAEEKMEVVRIAEIDTRDAKIGAAVRAATMKRRSELPPILEGLSANQIAAILDERDRDFLEMLADQQSEFWERREKLKAAMENE